ncbi:MAG: YggT family protein [Deltaproteobacteria bacterium]|jgi:YggT family protein|nr:YggT family protein [Deltaproteobacteria bacterium]
MIKTLGHILYLLITIYGWVVLLRILISWFAPNPHSPFMRRLRQATDPALNLTRRLCPLSLGGLDFSPVLLIVFLYFIGNFIFMGSQALGAGASPAVLLPVLVCCLVQLVMSLTMFLMIIMIARAVLSLVKPDPYNTLVLMVYGATEPLLAPLRAFIPMRGPWGLDLRAVLFVAFLLLFYAFLLQNLQLMALGWARKYGFGAAF